MRQLESDEFVHAVYEVVKRIPRGRVTSYGAIARALGCPTWARQVGRVMARCGAYDSLLPAHRVVNAQGVLSGRNAFTPADTMQQRLEAEGIRIVNHRVQAWKQLFWDPLFEIEDENSNRTV